MAKPIPAGRIAGLNIALLPSAMASFLFLWLLLGAAAFWLLKMPPATSLIGGLLAAMLHFAAEFWHQLGHSAAARRVGYPMTGVVFWGFLAASRYPSGEDDLAPGIHIRRALGGPLASCLMSLLTGIAALALRTRGGLVFWLASFAAIDNLVVFTLGALLPLGFTDGSTLLTWGRRLRQGVDERTP